MTLLYPLDTAWFVQLMMVQVGGQFVRTSPLNVVQWFVCIALGFGSCIVGTLMRFIPVTEDPDNFFDNSQKIADSGKIPGIELPSLPSDPTTQKEDDSARRNNKGSSLSVVHCWS
jgi:hypothetical protein